MEQVRQKVQQTVTQVSAFLGLVADINIARHLDIDGIRQTDAVPNDGYSSSVDNARRLVRTLETVLQALYDDTAALLLTTQNIRENDPSQTPGDLEASYDLLDKLSTGLSSNLSLCRQTTESILSVGHEQADLAQGDYIGSIEWRMSRLSVINGQFAGAAGQPSLFPDEDFDSGNEDVVGLEDAFNRPGTRKKSVKGAQPDMPYEQGQSVVTLGTTVASSTSLLTDGKGGISTDDTIVAQDVGDDQDPGEDDDLDCTLSSCFPELLCLVADLYRVKCCQSPQCGRRRARIWRIGWAMSMRTRSRRIHGRGTSGRITSLRTSSSRPKAFVGAPSLHWSNGSRRMSISVGPCLGVYTSLWLMEIRSGSHVH